MTSAAQTEPADFSHHLKVLGLDDGALAEARQGDQEHPERDFLLQHLEDSLPAVADVIRRAGASVIVAASFERRASNVWGVLLIAPPRDRPFSVAIYEDRIQFHKESSLRVGVLDFMGIRFWLEFSEKLGSSLARGFGGGVH
jgi:hypothetical protein